MCKPIHIVTTGMLVCVFLGTACRQQEETPAETGGQSDRDALTTPQQREDLSTDLRQADLSLTAIEDSIRNFLGMPDATDFQDARALWDQYRKAECDALRFYFENGTIAPVAQLACLVALTDARRRFLAEQYDFIGPPRAVE